jgi:ATP phosphoribosyltransferase regulatory subunit
MLRPDFTVPVVQMHMEHGAEPALYTYAGEVFRRQEEDAQRANEYTQVGFEIFERAAPEAADAEVFAMFFDILRPLGLRAATGDIGILMAAVEGLRTTERRKAALRRHIWRPRRFRALMDRYSGRAVVPEARAALLASADPMAGAEPMIGLRGPDEIAGRITALLKTQRQGRFLPLRCSCSMPSSRCAKPVTMRWNGCAILRWTCPPFMARWTVWRGA